MVSCFCALGVTAAADSARSNAVPRDGLALNDAVPREEVTAPETTPETALVAELEVLRTGTELTKGSPVLVEGIDGAV